MRGTNLKISVIFLAIAACSVSPVQKQFEGHEKLLALVNKVMSNTTYTFIDSDTGKRYNSTKDLPEGLNLKIESPYNDWRYWNGVLAIGMIKLGETLKDKKYIDYAVKNEKFNFDNYKYFVKGYDGNKWGYPYAQRFIMEELDDYGAMTAGLIEVYKYDPEKRYLDYINTAGDYISNKQHRYSDGSFIRSFPKQWTLWADDLYMSISFLCRMGELTGDNKYFDDAAKQVINYHQHLFDELKGLMYHNWYSDDNKTGVAFWGRANGWAVLAQIDLLERLPVYHPQRQKLIDLYKKHISGIVKYQSQNGLWHQLLDKNDSYLETSCSAMFVYSIAKAVNLGILDKSYYSAAEKGWEGICTKISDNGDVEGVCTGTVVSDNLEDYYNRPAPLNDVHGLGTVILAGSEIINLTK